MFGLRPRSFRATGFVFAALMLGALLFGVGVAAAAPSLGPVPSPDTPQTVAVNAPFSVSGAPCGWAGSRVLLVLQRQEGARWASQMAVTVTADADGSYLAQVTLPHPGQWRVRALYSLSHRGASTSEWRTFTVAAAPGPEVRNSISGHVVDTDGHGIGGIDVTAWANVVLNDGTSVDYYNTAVTDADGSYKVPDLVGEAAYTVSLGDPQSRFVTRGMDREVYVNADVEGVDFTLAQGGGISGHARDDHGQPVLGVDVSLDEPVSGYMYGDWTTTGADGVYNFVNEPVSAYGVYFAEQSGANGDMLLDGQSGFWAQVLPGQTVAGPDATYTQGGFITGMTVDGNKGVPVGGLNVDVFPTESVSGYMPFSVSGYGSQTDELTGRFSVLVRPGSYSLGTSDFRGIYDPATVSGYGDGVTVGSGETVDVPPIPEYSSRSDVHYVSGEVTDGATGVPLAGATVFINGWNNWSGTWVWGWYDHMGATDGDGQYAFLVPGTNQDYPNGWTYSLDVSDWPGYADKYALFELDDADVAQDFALEPVGGGSVSGRITDSHGDALPNVMVFAESVSGYGTISGYSGGAQTDDHGDYKIDGLPTSNDVRVVVNSFDGPDEYNPYADRPMVAYLDHPFFPGMNTVSGYTQSESVSGYDAVSVSEGQTTSGIDQTLPLSGHIQCTALSAAGPMGGVEVSLEYKYKGTWTRIGSGGFTVAGVLNVDSLWPGDYRVSYKDIFGRIDGSHDRREVHVSEGATSTVALIQPAKTTTVTLPGGRTVGASFSGAITSDGVLSVEPTTTIPALPAGTFQVAGSTYEVTFTGSYSGVWTLTLPYDPSLPDAMAALITVNHFNTSTDAWESLTPTSVDMVHHTVTVQTSSLSPFALTIPQSAIHKAQFSAPTASEIAPYVGASVSIDTTLTDADTSAALAGRTDVFLASSTDGGSTWTTGTTPATSLGNGKYRAAFIASTAAPVAYRLGVASAEPYFTGAHSSNVTVTALPTNTSWSGAVLPGGATRVVVGYGASVSVMGSLNNTSGVALATSGDVVVQTSKDGVAFTDTAMLAQKVATGSYAAVVAPSVKTYYRFHFKGDSTNNPSYSASVFVAPQVKLTKPSVKSSKVKAHRSFAVTGNVYPAHAKSARTVKVFYERLKGKKWVKLGSVWAKNTPKTGYSIYSVSFKLKAGTYRFYAAAPEDSDHAATGNTKAITVKVK